MTYVFKFAVNTEGIPTRAHNRLMKINMEEIGQYHKEKTMPRHFKINADTRPGGAYGYDKRSRYTQIRKKRKYGHLNPNMMTGKLRDKVLRESTVKAFGTKFKFRARSYFPMIAQRRAELESMSPAEVEKYSNMLQRLYVLRSKQKQYQRKRRL
jgi:hypothetical protein